MDSLLCQGLPDLAAVTRWRLANPQPVENGREAALAMGRSILRQLMPGGAPGGTIAVRSSNVGGCARKLYYATQETPPNGRERDGRTVATFATGDAIEGLLTLALSEALKSGQAASWRLDDVRSATGQASVYYDADVPGLEVPFPIAGHPDGLLSVDATDPCIQPWVERYKMTVTDGRVTGAVLEIKSASGFAVKKIQERLDIGEEGWSPEDGYWWQVQTYMHATRTPLAYCLVLGKDTGTVVGFWMRVNHGYRDMLSEHLGRVLTGDGPAPRILADGTAIVPSPRAGKLPWQCRFCAYYRTCWGEGLEERATKDFRGNAAVNLYVAKKICDEGSETVD